MEAPQNNKKDCACCLTVECCRTYNKVGLFLFVMWFVLQIVSITTPWEVMELSRTYRPINQNPQDQEQITLRFYAEAVEITHSLFPGQNDNMEKKLLSHLSLFEQNISSLGYQHFVKYDQSKLSIYQIFERILPINHRHFYRCYCSRVYDDCVVILQIIQRGN